MHRVKVGDTIKILKDNVNGTDEKEGAKLKVMELLPDILYSDDGIFYTNRTCSTVICWSFGNFCFDNGGIELSNDITLPITSPEVKVNLDGKIEEGYILRIETLEKELARIKEILKGI